MSLKPSMARAQHTRGATSVSLAGTLVNHPTDGDGHPCLHSSSAPVTVSGPDTKDDPSCHRPVNRGEQCESGTIPPKHSNRTLILCFDGTAEEFNTTNSNVVQFVSLLKKDDCSQQVVYYQSGIGSYETTQMSSKPLSKIWKLLDFMFAWDLNAHVMSGYEFLMQSYTPGDKICLFGFSRGAHTARSLAGMIQKVGLLTPNNVQQIPFAYKMYNRCDNAGWAQSDAFKKAFCLDVGPIEFIGVWDTVASVGLLPRKLPFASSPTAIRTFRHALSLDERRVNFKATPWNRPDKEEAKLGVDGSKTFMAKAKAHLDEEDSDGEDNKHEFPSTEEEQEDQCRTDVKEVWFAGCHCDVGGGSVSNDTRNSLARIPLRWMVRECFRTNTGIMFDTQGLREIGLDPSTLYPSVAPRPAAIAPGNAHIREIPQNPEPPSWIRRVISRLVAGKSSDPLPNTTTVDENMADEASVGTEDQEDLKDALSPLYDELKLLPAWWIPEFLPIKVRCQREDDSWDSHYTFNRGHPRNVPAQDRGVKIHRSVKIREEASYRSGKKYQPRPTITVIPTWVD